MYYAIETTKLILSAVLFSETISSINLPLQPMNNISGAPSISRFIEEISLVIPKRIYIPKMNRLAIPKRLYTPKGNRLAIPKKVYIPKEEYSLPGPAIKAPHSTEGNTGDLMLVISRKKNRLLLDLGRNLEATSVTLSSKKELRPIIKEVLETKIFREDPQTLLVYKAAKSQIRDVNNLTLGKCNDAIRKIEAIKGITISDSDRLVIAAAILLGVIVIVV